jgi:hypothetical protein
MSDLEKKRIDSLLLCPVGYIDMILTTLSSTYTLAGSTVLRTSCLVLRAGESETTKVKVSRFDFENNLLKVSKSSNITINLIRLKSLTIKRNKQEKVMSSSEGNMKYHAKESLLE